MIVKVAAVAATEPVFSWYIYHQQNNLSFQDFSLLGHDAMYIGVYIPLFWSTLLSQAYVWVLGYTEDGVTKLLQNNGAYTPIYTMSSHHNGEFKYSSTSTSDPAHFVTSCF